MHDFQGCNLVDHSNNNQFEDKKFSQLNDDIIIHEIMIACNEVYFYFFNHHFKPENLLKKYLN